MNDRTPIIKKYPSVAQSFGIVGIMVLASIVFAPSMIIFKSLGNEASFFIYYLLTGGITAILVYTIRKKETGIYRIGYLLREPSGIPFLILASIAILFAICTPLISLIPVPEVIQEVFRNLGSQTGVFAFLTMVILAPVFEEIIFRGIMLDGLLKRYSPLKAILLSSFLFGLVHLNPWQFIPAFFIGLFAGWVYLRTRSITPCIIIHATTNLAGYLVRLLATPEMMEAETIPEIYGSYNSFLFTLVAGIVIISMSVYLLHRIYPASEADDSVESAHSDAALNQGHTVNSNL